MTILIPDSTVPQAPLVLDLATRVPLKYDVQMIGGHLLCDLRL